ncbi:MAG: hypothetical protein EHM17_09580 [Verrucomicrobiaceae bacterium]|nr:MAG: hypothetical protein EHM17_09580 [Verrucomicrobiaceae bacterium]
MTEPTLFWFHCGRCGSLFQAPAGHSKERLCPHCGADPSPGVVETTAETPSTPTETEANGGNPANHSRRSVRKHKNRNFMFVFTLGWCLILGLIIIAALKLRPPQAAETAPEPAAEAQNTPVQTGNDIAIYQNAGPKCSQAFAQFLAAGTPEQSNQFVISPVSTAARMERFLSLNPIPAIDPASLELAGSGLLHLPDGTAFEAQWKSADGRILDTVFREENGEWRLDWEHYARYSDHPWPLFLAGNGPDECEFRLLARERLAEERKGEPTISLVFYAPHFGNPQETRSQSPEFLVSRNTRDGKLLDAAFKLARSGGRVFGGKLPSLDPEGMIRVRVKIRRSEGGENRKFEVVSVNACHWLSHDDPGVQPDEPAETETQETR